MRYRRKMSHTPTKKTRLLKDMLCPLCSSQNTEMFQAAQLPTTVFHCQHCDLIFKHPDSHLSLSVQKERYDTHNNQTADEGYVKFLNQMVNPLLKELETKASIADLLCLDWGSGPGSVLADLLKQHHLQVETYDPVYQPVLPQQKFDVITCTEVIEHFHEPKQSFHEVDRFLKEQGLFAGLTAFHQGPEAFKTWWYARDKTHVVFYSEKTFHWIAENFNFEILKLASPVFLLRKNEAKKIGVKIRSKD